MLAVPALMRGDLRRSDIAAYGGRSVWCGLLAAFVSRVERRQPQQRASSPCRDLVAGVSAFAIGCGLIAAGIIYQGTSLRALFEGLFVAPLLLSKLSPYQLPVPALFAAAAPATLLAAWCWHRGLIRQRWIQFAALGVGRDHVHAVGRQGVLGAFRSGAAACVAGAVLTVQSAQNSARRDAFWRSPRFSWGFRPIPCPGTQIVFGTVLYVPLALVMIAGVERTLTCARALLAGGATVVRPARTAGGACRGGRGQPRYAGAALLRTRRPARPARCPGACVPPSATSRPISWLSANMRENCDAFVTAPGLNSLHFWTEMRARLDAQYHDLADAVRRTIEQRRILAAAERVERLCVAWSPARMDPVHHPSRSPTAHGLAAP